MEKQCGSCKIIKSNFRTVKEKRTKNIKEYLCSICRDCEKERALNNYKNNREKYIEMNKIYKNNNKEKINETRRKYNLTIMKNPEEKIKRNMKSLISSKIKKTRHTGEYLGTTMTIIIKWLEYNFEENMNWENYGKYWEIDHTIPISLFDINNENEMLLCFCWMNLMPMLKIKNSKKSNKILLFRIFLQETKLKNFIKQLPQLKDYIYKFINDYSNKLNKLLHTQHV
jgi:hypothetical protein